MKMHVLLGAVSVAALSIGTSAGAQTAQPETGQSMSPNNSQQTQPSPPVASDAAGIGDIIVTARKREERLQNVPVAVTAYSGEKLRDEHIQNPLDLQYTTPGLSLVTQGSGTANYTLRGQGVSYGGNPSVITYFAGAPGATGDLSFYDLSSIQVLKGPQGTLFGRTSTGGAILFEPARPSYKLDGYLDEQFGNLGYERLEGAINVPVVTDILAVRAAGFLLRRNGYTTSYTTGQRLQDEHRDGFRVSALFTPVDMFESETIFDWGDIDEAGVADHPGVVTAVNLPAAFFAATFGGVCGAAAADNAVSNANEPAFVAGCVAQRGALYNQAVNTLQAESARFNSSDAAKRLSGTGLLGSYRSTNWVINNRSTLKFGGSGFLTDANIKNIFSYSRDPTPQSEGATDLDGANTLFGDTHYPSTLLTPGPCVTSGPNIGKCSYPVYGPDPVNPSPHTLTEEVNVSAKLGGKLDLIGGFFYLRNTRGSTSRASFAVYNNVFSPELQPALVPFGTSFTRNTERGLFIQGTLDLSDWLLHGLSVTAGYRNTKTKTSAGAIGFEGAPPVDLVNKSAGNNRTFSINWQAERNLLVYLRSSTGFKPGGTNSVCVGQDDPLLCPVKFRPENVLDYEFGIKADYNLGNIRARTNIALFTSNYKDIQRLANTPNKGGGTTGETVNTANARIRGLEVEQTLSVSGFTLDAGFSYTDAKYTKYFVQDPVGGLPCSDLINNSKGDCAIGVGSRFSYLPKYQANLRALYNISLPGQGGTVTPSVEYNFQSSRYYGVNNVLSLPTSSFKAYGLLDARVEWSNVLGYPIDAALWGQNLTNKVYGIQGNDLTNTLGFSSLAFGAPRTFGVELRYRFGASASR